jgi:hypothetical protein
MILEALLQAAWLCLAFSSILALRRYTAEGPDARNRAFRVIGSLVLVVLSHGLIVFASNRDLTGSRFERLVKDFLKTEDLSGLTDRRSEFQGGLDYTAWIYFRASQGRIEEIVRRLKFRRLEDGRPGQGMELAKFGAAPSLPAVDEAVVYFRECPEKNDIQYIVTDLSQEQLWFVSADY